MHNFSLGLLCQPSITSEGRKSFNAQQILLTSSALISIGIHSESEEFEILAWEDPSFLEGRDHPQINENKEIYKIIQNMSVFCSYFMHLLCYSDIRLNEAVGTKPRPAINKSVGGHKIMAITRWDPFRDVVALQNRMNSLFREFNENDGPLTTASFVPAVDIYEDSKKVVLKLEVPGMDEKDLDIRVENNTLTVKGERKFEKDEKEENFHRIERRYGTFYRSFTLPSTVDTENVNASYTNGILKLELNKKPEAQPKQIKVNFGSQSKLEHKKEEPELVGTR